MCLLLSREKGGASFKRGTFIRERRLTVAGGGGRLIERGWLCDSVFLTITRCVQ